MKDEKGRKMSKTLGNVVDPVQVIESYSCDALRFTLATGMPQMASSLSLLFWKQKVNMLASAARLYFPHLLFSAGTASLTQPPHGTAPACKPGIITSLQPLPVSYQQVRPCRARAVPHSEAVSTRRICICSASIGCFLLRASTSDSC